jgi:transcriptional regulator with XRE-family HTH domain
LTTTDVTTEKQPSEMRFGERLGYARRRKGYSVDHLADMLGVRGTTVKRWESDHVQPRANRVHVLAGALGVPMRWLISGTGELDRAEAGAGQTRMEEIVLLRELRSLSHFMIEAEARLARLERRLVRIIERDDHDDSAA